MSDEQAHRSLWDRLVHPHSASGAPQGAETAPPAPAPAPAPAPIHPTAAVKTEGPFVAAFEDLDEDARTAARRLGSVPEGVGLGRHVLDVLENGVAEAYGNIERIFEFQHGFHVVPYLHEVSASVTRGARPSAAKLTCLAEQAHFLTTVNLCAESPDGDEPLIHEAGLDGKLNSLHVRVVDGEAPTDEQLVAVLDWVEAPEHQPAYVHCEAGVGRTGVVVACYRMAIEGWAMQDARDEASRFGCKVPEQQRFVEDIGERLLANWQARSVATGEPDESLGRYPLSEPGSTRPTPEQLAADITSARTTGTSPCREVD